MKSNIKILVLFLLVGILCGCTPTHTCGTNTKKSCRACANSRKPCGDLWLLLPAAKRGDAKALHKAFATARQQVSMPFENAGEDAEAMTDNFFAILKSTGDTTFAKALSEERPKTRSAVREFFFAQEVKHDYPQTYSLLANAPLIDWPSDKAYRRSWAPNTPPEKEIWK